MLGFTKRSKDTRLANDYDVFVKMDGFDIPGYSGFLLSSSGNPAVFITFNQKLRNQAALGRV